MDIMGAHSAAMPIAPLSIILLVHIFVSEDVLLKLLLALPKCPVMGRGGLGSVPLNRHLSLFRSMLSPGSTGISHTQEMRVTLQQ